MHSWAFDGLRAKKWNVSCEPYGRRWRQGDVIGSLIDMDLLEMRFFINGEDLGPAFYNFGNTDIFPALSLNVRQCIRVNFGQYKFIHPPDEIDGKGFRPVSAALTLPKAAGGGGNAKSSTETKFVTPMKPKATGTSSMAASSTAAAGVSAAGQKSSSSNLPTASFDGDVGGGAGGVEVSAATSPMMPSTPMSAASVAAAMLHRSNALSQGGPGFARPGSSGGLGLSPGPPSPGGSGEDGGITVPSTPNTSMRPRRRLARAGESVRRLLLLQMYFGHLALL